ncbi:MAG: sulfotransferase domain-containing protein [Chloroflexi bacterium]|nr:sulfotransferase domain-containing protein [Chloroflexota bacterium]
MSICWLASYPKSGNTWLRVFLDNYWEDRDQPADINRLQRTSLPTVRVMFDNTLVIESGLLTKAEVDALRPRYYRQFATKPAATDKHLCKVHDAYTYLPDGAPLHPTDVSFGVIYLIRNPLDVAISYAHHSATDIDTAIDLMSREIHTLAAPPNTEAHQIGQRLMSWSGHVRSWVDQAPLQRLVVRYEDLVAQPQAAFARVIAFLSWDLDSARLEKAIRFSSFSELKQQERAHGFHEKNPDSESFFRKGKSGDWRATLTAAQIQRIVADHGEIMARFDYLPG